MRTHHPAQVAGPYFALSRQRPDPERFHAIYTVMLMESRAYSSSSNEETITSVHPHTIEPDYSHLNSIPRAEPSVRVTITLGEENDSDATRLISFQTIRLLSDERLRVTE